MLIYTKKIIKLWYIHPMKCHPAVRISDVDMHLSAWINTQYIVLSKQVTPCMTFKNIQNSTYYYLMEQICKDMTRNNMHSDQNSDFSGVEEGVCDW